MTLVIQAAHVWAANSQGETYGSQEQQLWDTARGRCNGLICRGQMQTHTAVHAWIHVKIKSKIMWEWMIAKLASQDVLCLQKHIFSPSRNNGCNHCYETQLLFLEGGEASSWM